MRTDKRTLNLADSRATKVRILAKSLRTEKREAVLSSRKLRAFFVKYRRDFKISVTF